MRRSECYTLLEVAPGATLDEIKASYRKLAFRYHPDLNPGDSRAAERFTRLNEAYVFLKKSMETRADASGKRRYSAENIRQEEEAKSATSSGRRPSAFYTKQEEVLRDILNDPFAKQVFEDIFSKLKRGDDPGTVAPESVQTKNLHVRWGQRGFNLNLSKGVIGAVRDWASRQLDDHQTVHMPAYTLIPGTTLRVQIRHRFAGDARTIEVTLPPDFVVGRPVRLKGLGRHLGPWHGDLYLRFLAK